jgi:mycothiol synthase
MNRAARFDRPKRHRADAEERCRRTVPTHHTPSLSVRWNSEGAITASYSLVSAADIDAVRDLLDAALEADDRPPLSEHKAIRVGRADDSIEVLGRDSVSAVGYAQAAWHHSDLTSDDGHWGVEVVLAPGARKREDVAAAIGAVSELLAGHRPHIWAAFPYLASGLVDMGYAEVRRLLRLGRGLPTDRRWPLPPGIRLERFTPDADNEEWLALNNAAFADHPENGALDEADLADRFRQPWFDPAGFLVARDGPDLVGSCWTKLHGDGTGEIYIIAVAPGAEGGGIGKGLLTAGMDYLAEVRGAHKIVLYTEADNRRGLGFYENAGFTVEESTGQYEQIRPADSSDQPKR